MKRTWRLLMDDGATPVTQPEQLTGYWGKSLIIDGPCELRLTVDYDDVPHDDVAREAVQLVNLLNAAEVFGE